MNEIILRNNIEQLKQSLTECRKELILKHNIAKFKRVNVSTNITIYLENKELCDKTKTRIVEQSNIYSLGEQNEKCEVNFCNKIYQNNFEEMALFEDLIKVTDSIKEEYTDRPINDNVKDAFNIVDDLVIEYDHESLFKNTDPDDYKENYIEKQLTLSCETCKKGKTLK